MQNFTYQTIKEKRRKAFIKILIIGSLIFNIWTIWYFIITPFYVALKTGIIKIAISILLISYAIILKKTKISLTIIIYLTAFTFFLYMGWTIFIIKNKNLSSVILNFSLTFLIFTIFGKLNWKELIIIALLSNTFLITYLMLKYNNIQSIEFSTIHSIFIFITIQLFSIIFSYYFEITEMKAEQYKINLQIANEKLLKANNQLKEKQKEIENNLIYAANIQHTLLANEEDLKLYFNNNYFLIYIPKFIVSGDFIWIKKVKDTTLLAIADATGHGVPAALMSIFCNSIINNAFQSIKEYEPYTLLKKIITLLNTSINKYKNFPTSGMDISIISIEKNFIKFAGYNSHIYALKKDNSLIRLKNNYAIMNIKEIKIIYLLTDGIYHQLGGKYNHKLGMERFETLLKKVAHLPLQKQKEKILNVLSKWQGTHKQTDDITLLAIKI